MSTKNPQGKSMNTQKGVRSRVMGLGVAIAALLCPSVAHAQSQWYVDDDDPNCCNTAGCGTSCSPFCTIEDATDAAVAGDTVWVRPGTYTGDNGEIDFSNKALKVRSTQGPASTTILGTVFLANGPGPQTLLEGFTVTNTDPFNNGGVGIEFFNASPTLDGNIIVRRSRDAALGVFVAG